MLGLLAGVFVGVLSMKLFVPRPPDGAGPDIHTAHEFAETQQVVEPPALARPSWDFAAAPPLVSDKAAAATPASDLAAEPPVATVSRALAPLPAATGDDLLPPPDFAAEPPRSRFAVQPASAIEPAEHHAAAAVGSDADHVGPPSAAAATPPPAQDPFVARTAWQEPIAAAPPDAAPVAAAESPITAGGRHVVQNGDSWWSLAERAYGDGRLYRALYAWNRVLDPRVALAP